MKIFLFIQKICTSFHYDIFITLFFPTNNIIVVRKEHFDQQKRGILIKIVTDPSKDNFTETNRVQNLFKSRKSTKSEPPNFKLCPT